jgi:hypothetical protein
MKRIKYPSLAFAIRKMGIPNLKRKHLIQFLKESNVLIGNNTPSEKYEGMYFHTLYCFPDKKKMKLTWQGAKWLIEEQSDNIKKWLIDSGYNDV